MSAVRTADVAEPAIEPIREGGLAHEVPHSVPTSPDVGHEPTSQAELPREPEHAQKRKASASGRPKNAHSKKLSKAKRKELTAKKLVASAPPKAKEAKVRRRPRVESKSPKK